MRRLENEDEGKFWEAWIKDELVFCYRYGKIGSAGHLKLKKFKTRAEAEAELEEKLAEKLEEGFEEPGAEPEEAEEEAAAAEDENAEADEEEDENAEADDEEDEEEGENAEADDEEDEDAEADDEEGENAEADDEEDEDAEADDEEDEDAEADDEEDEADGEGVEPPRAQQAPPKPTLRARVRPCPTSSERIDAAVSALGALADGAGKRSWKVGRLARRARRALERLGGVEIAGVPAVSEALDAVTARVIAPKGRLALDDVLTLLWVVDAATFARTVHRWRARMLDAPATPAIGVLAATFEGLGETEVAVHVATALADRRLSREAFRRWLARLRPFLGEALEAKGSSVERFAKALRPGADALLRSRVDEVRA